MGLTLTIDSQLWIYYFDTNAQENPNVQKWMREVIPHSKIWISSIIPMEVAHNLYKVTNLGKEDIEKLLIKWITHENIFIIDTNHQILLIAFDLLKSYRNMGIGGRDCLILASMLVKEIDTIATHDKNILNLDGWNRIDPVLNPPLKLVKGEKLDMTVFEKI